MSDFSDFFPAAGGGGIGKTVTVGDYSYGNSWPLATIASNRLMLYGTGNGSGKVVSSLTLTTAGSGPTRYGISMPSSDTYYTVADITSSNGGACYGIYGINTDTGNAAANRQWTFKITLDGATAVEYAFVDPSNSRAGFAVMGKAWEIVSTWGYGSYGQAISGQIGFVKGDDSALPMYRYYDATTSSNYGYWDEGNMDQSINAIDAITASQRGLPFLHFTSSLKIETKSASLNTPCWGSAEIITF
jgi:hypothetical protein